MENQIPLLTPYVTGRTGVDKDFTIKTIKKDKSKSSLTRQGSEADWKFKVHKKRPSDTLKPLQLT